MQWRHFVHWININKYHLARVACILIAPPPNSPTFKAILPQFSEPSPRSYFNSDSSFGGYTEECQDQMYPPLRLSLTYGLGPLMDRLNKWNKTRLCFAL
ncbi:hypothetical protein QVD17_27826 [Tagetes erecta]|uniref:Uncharacterized protein n=1 Tax=Tagetes erecta TaxID=13708 RepID=A0AAD8NJV6_TARER|nr:hypothetical protein QVD17_27826 [Tagetes erecta]